MTAPLVTEAEKEAFWREYNERSVWDFERRINHALEAAARVRKGNGTVVQPATIAELDAILNSEGSDPVHVNIDGSVARVREDERRELVEMLDRCANDLDFMVQNHMREGPLNDGEHPTATAARALLAKYEASHDYAEEEHARETTDAMADAFIKTIGNAISTIDPKTGRVYWWKADLRAAIAAAMQAAWRPIETAPKDEPILAFWPNGEIYTGSTDGKRWDSEFDQMPWSMPTHYQPLPPPPKGAVK